MKQSSIYDGLGRHGEVLCNEVSDQRFVHER